MNEQAITCPKCGCDIPLSEAFEERVRQQLQRQEVEFRRELEEKLQKEYEKKVVKLNRSNEDKDKRIAEMEGKELELREQRKALEDEKRRQKLDFARQLDESREQIRAKAIKEALEQHQVENAERDRQLKELKGKQAEFARRQTTLSVKEQSFDSCVEEQVRVKEADLKRSTEEQVARRYTAELESLRSESKESQKRIRTLEDEELTLRKEKQLLEADRRRLELEVTRRVDAERERVRSETTSEVEERYRLKDLEKDKQLGDLKQQLDIMKRKMEQGSQQLQGEVLELDIEALLSTEFPEDTVEPVQKGVRGADVLQHVHSHSGRNCGLIVWEAKRTRNWSEGWILKLKENQRRVSAEIAILVTDALPKDIRHFGFRDGIWVTDPQHVLGVATILRTQVLRVGQLKQAMDGKQEKAEVLYAYLTSVEFRHRVEAMVEAFISMKADLDQERRAMERLWSKREKELTHMVDNVSGMYGDLQGIVGSSLPPIKNLALPDETGTEPKREEVPF